MQEYQERLAVWLKKVKKMRSIIESTISTLIIIYIEGIDNSTEIWRILFERFNSITKTIFLQIIKEFIMIKMNETMDIIEIYLQKM